MSKEHFQTIASRMESKGLLPKGKTADLMENYDFITKELDDEAKAAAEAEVDHDALDEKTKARARKV